MNVYFDTEDTSKTTHLGVMDLATLKKRRKVTVVCAVADDGSIFQSDNNPAVKFLLWLVEYVEQKKEHVTVYALNLQYDLGNIFENNLDAVEPLMFGGKLLSAQWGPSITFKDLRNLWPSSVAKIGESVGMLKKEFDATGTEYCLQDAQIVKAGFERIQKYARKYGVTKIPTTMATLSWKMYLEMSCSEVFWQCHDEWFREGYFGGRCEVFKSKTTENTGVRHTDINSLYPYCMTKEFPANNLVSLTGWDMAEPYHLHKFGMTECDIYIPKSFNIGLLPVKTETGNAYPVGLIRGVWTNHEIRFACENGAELRCVYKSMGTNDSVYPFKEYIERMYSDRLNAATKDEKDVLKLFMNSLYGHLALKGDEMFQGVERTSELFHAFVDELGEREENVFVECYGKRALIPKKLPIPESTNILWAAYITSYARIELLSYILPLNKRIMYVDTDSLFFMTDGPLFEESNTALGKMKLEKQITAKDAEKIRFLVPKTYRVTVNGNETIKTKGVYQSFDKNGKQTKESKEQSKQFIEQGTTTVLKPYKLKESINVYDNDNAKPLSYWHPETKRFLGGVEGNEHYRTVKRYDNGLWFPKDFADLDLPKSAD